MRRLWANVVVALVPLIGCVEIIELEPQADGGLADGAADADLDRRDADAGQLDADLSDADEDRDLYADADDDQLTEPDGDLSDAGVDAGADADGETAPGCVLDEECDDAIDCTFDVCEAGACHHRPRDELCEEGDRVCVAGVGCALEVWVDTMCTSCGEGTSAEPFATIGEALDAVEPLDDGAVVRVAAGTYDERTRDLEDVTGLIIVGEPGTIWRTADDVAIKASRATSITLRGLELRAEKRAVECRDESSCTLEMVTLTGCSEAGIKVTNDASAVLRRALVQGNGRSGLRVEGRGAVSVFDSMIVANGQDGGDAGGIWLRDPGTSLRAVNCTIADNDSPGRPGALRSAPDAARELVNLIIWNNSTGDGASCQGCLLGDDSLADEDPLFVVAEGGRMAAEDYRISAASPARDRGVPRRDEGDVTDFFGTERTDGLTDAGAHEYR